MITSFQEALPDNEACQILACLPEKFIVDFANGIDITQDHLRVQKNRSFFMRVKEGTAVSLPPASTQLIARWQIVLRPH